jgi:hypothetical protein
MSGIKVKAKLINSNFQSFDTPPEYTDNRLLGTYNLEIQLVPIDKCGYEFLWAILTASETIPLSLDGFGGFYIKECDCAGFLAIGGKYSRIPDEEIEFLKSLMRDGREVTVKTLENR